MLCNYEFKARCTDLQQLETLLQPYHPRIIGDDEQVDTYFNVPYGRLKLREGKLENALIHYQRSNIRGPKQSDVQLYQHEPDSSLKQLLTAALGVLKVVTKRRRILFVDNVKFHFDEVVGLGTFVEVEAIDKDGLIGIDQLQEQCRHFAQLFRIKETDYIADSYSDLL
ncbi:MAG: class IV adenylate cyclase [Flavisolibacter sp.]|nr:class IV adenylate cyclase [Flavisolibacter sp.]